MMLLCSYILIIKELHELNLTCLSRTLLLTIWLTSSCGHQSEVLRRLQTETVGATVETGPHHADELDELKADCDDHRVLEVGHRTDHLVVASEELLHQAGLIR